MTRQALALVSTMVLATNTGCSWIFMTKAPEPVMTPNYPVECTSSSAAPILDTICTGYFAVNTLVIAGIPDCSEASLGESCITNRGAGIALSAGLGAVCLAGAMSGYGKAQRCQAVKNQNALCITGNQEACRALNPAWNPAASPAPTTFKPLVPAPPPPAQRADGLAAGAVCTATWQCQVGLACVNGVCAAQ